MAKAIRTYFIFYSTIQTNQSTGRDRVLQRQLQSLLLVVVAVHSFVMVASTLLLWQRDSVPVSFLLVFSCCYCFVVVFVLDDRVWCIEVSTRATAKVYHHPYSEESFTLTQCKRRIKNKKKVTTLWPIQQQPPQQDLRRTMTQLNKFTTGTFQSELLRLELITSSRDRQQRQLRKGKNKPKNKPPHQLTFLIPIGKFSPSKVDKYT
jgi:hypothetical protein